MKKLSYSLLLFLICLFIPITASAIKITEVVPPIGPIGLPVIIKGEFNDNPPLSKEGKFSGIVMFGNEESAEVELLSDTEIRVITPVSPSGPVDVTVEYSDGRLDTLPNGFTYDGFFVFNPKEAIGGGEGIFDPDTGQNIPIYVDIPLTSLPPNDRYPSIYIKPVSKEILLKKGFNIDRIIWDIIVEIKVRNEAGDMITRFDDLIFITFLIDSTRTPSPNVLLLSAPTEDKIFRPIPTKVRTALSLPLLDGKIKHLSADSNYLAAGINRAPTINFPDDTSKINTMSVENTVSVTGTSAQIILEGSDPDRDSLTFIITELPIDGYLHDGEIGIFRVPFAITSKSPLEKGEARGDFPFEKGGILTYTPRTGYFGKDQFQYKISDSAMESETQFVYLDVSLPPPKVTRITPAIGPTSGGMAVMVTGENFLEGTKVYFGSQEATSVILITSDLLAAFTPPVLSPDFVSVKITNPDGQSATLEDDGSVRVSSHTMSSSRFTYSLPPVVTEINPESGSMSGGTSVTITGEHFIGGETDVYIGKTKVTDFQVNSSTNITAITPPSPPGTKDVIVVTPGGTSEGVTTDTGATVTFTYTPTPIINSVSPTHIPTSGGTALNLTGGYFIGTDGNATGVTVAIGGTPALVTLITDTLIVATAPPGPPSDADVVVTTSGGQSVTLTQGVTYTSSPVVTSINPLSGSASGGASLTIEGANFVSGTTVTIGGELATNVVFVSTIEITAITPPFILPSENRRFVDVVVTNPSGEFSKILSIFQYIAPPTIISVEPTEASVEGGNPLTITGANFDELATVSIGGEPAMNVVVDSLTQISAITPGSELGEDTTVDLVVTNFDGQTDRIDFTYKVYPPLRNRDNRNHTHEYHRLC